MANGFEFLAFLAQQTSTFSSAVGSLGGLLALSRHEADAAGVHLLDIDTGEYNVPFVRHLFPDREVVVLTLVHREQGLVTAPGNPLGLRDVEDLLRPDVRLINRNPGSGTRLWLDREIQRLGLTPKSIRGYGNFVHTHSESAIAVQSGQVDVALGIQAAAHQYNLDFIPLFDERYDLVVPQEQVKLVHPVLDALQTASFRRKLSTLTGYNTAHSGEQIQI